MNELVFVGLGLHDEKGISLQGLEETKTADHAFVELYTSLLPNFSMERFETLTGKKAQVLTRQDLEEQNGARILDAAEKGKTVFLVPGDPFIATTHVALRIEAEKRGIKTRIVHGASIISAIIGLSGLHNYKFGKAVTIPFPENTSETPYNVITQNKKLGLHTLCLLDIKTEEKRFLRINQALAQLLGMEQKKKQGTATIQTIAIGIARAGSNTPVLKADTIENLLTYDFGDPPQSLIFPGELHFMEAEALIALAGAPASLRGAAK
ncbi:MAG: diphthine synthase [Candidatus Bathyarchaeota archaeon]|nr:diphthine synthase [Candidatus Bathyarchaeota archaeon]